MKIFSWRCVNNQSAKSIFQDEWAVRATEAITLLEEAGFLLAEQCEAALESEAIRTAGIIEVHQSYPNSALQVKIAIMFVTYELFSLQRTFQKFQKYSLLFGLH